MQWNASRVVGADLRNARFDELYDQMQQEAVANTVQVFRAEYKKKIYGGLVVVMMLFLALSVLSNGLITYQLLENSKETTMSNDNTLVKKGGSQPVEVANVKQSLP